MTFPLPPTARRLLAGAALLLGAAAAPAATITIACGASAPEIEHCWKHAEAWAKKTGHTVRNYTQPNSPTAALAVYRQLFAAKSSDIDIVRIDVVWPGILKDHLVDLKPYTRGAEAEHFPAIIANNTVGGRLLGIPWYTDTGLLYYRADLLKKYNRPPPTTWAELGATAALVQAGERAAGQKDFQGFVFQAKSGESLTCNALEWIASFGGGRIVDASGAITVNNPQAVRALATAAQWVGSIASVGVLNYAEEDARGVFQNGQALFMRNWPYAWSLLESADSVVRGKVGVLPLPKGEGPGARHAGALGGWQLAVSKYSRHAAVAADLALYMASAPVQKERAIRSSFNPTRPALYKDPEVIAANAFMASLLTTFEESVARPSGEAGLKYPAVSLALANAAHDVLGRKATPEAAVRKLEGQLKLARRDRW
ncbi:MAG TPA: ABC transporter substrate-binding protein [Aquabacterium sp.]|nr:ABC transporter substrate-binding protein [Aquabacterium sp.]HQC98628.1 ABC transporter substrate-binding protein [Aquabacterium sp.]